MVSLRTLASILLALAALASEHGVNCHASQPRTLRGGIRRMVEDGATWLLAQTAQREAAATISAGGGASTGGKTKAAADDDDDAADDDAAATSSSTPKTSTTSATAAGAIPTTTAGGDDDDAADDDAANDDATGGGGGGASTSTKGSKGGSGSNSTSNLNDDDDGYPTMQGNVTSNEDFVLGDDATVTPADEVISDLKDRSDSMTLATKEGIAAVIVIAAGVAAALYVWGKKYCATKRAGYRTVGEVV